MHWRSMLASIGLCISLSHAVGAKTGDINGDGRTDSADLQILGQFLKGKRLLSDAETHLADIDADGQVTPSDADILKQRLKISSPTRVQAAKGLDSSSSGWVTDQQTGQPLAGVTIAVPDEDITVTTDQTGSFTLPHPLPSNRILTAKTREYAPFSLTTQKNQSQPFELKLEQLTARTVVLDDMVRHLGDNSFGSGSANFGQLRRPADGLQLERSFELDSVPDRDPYLRLGSLVGIDTPESFRAGQSQLALHQDGSANWAFRIYLNGTLVKRITLNGDNVVITLPRWLLHRGTNYLLLATAVWNAAAQSKADLFPRLGVEYDDMEFAHILLVLPTHEPQKAFRVNP